jgi:Adenylate and Guanylate cyclase catalytic domain/3'5'-cyclic nucleotide phosphodiesterase
VGDCYVAVTGLPKPRKDHAVVMVKFARECLRKMNSLTKKLEVRLGPDVSDLSMRVGIHSGSVTGGVLRGEGSRFQLFGDSMNTASRIETSGEPNRIHLSPTTAELIKEAGKEKWLKERATMVSLKGKGEMQTYWLKTGRSNTQDRSRSRNEDVEADHDDDSDSESDDDDSYSSYEDSLLEDDLIHTMVSEKTARLIEWNAEVLQRLLKQIVARRSTIDAAGKSQYWKTVGKSDSLLEEAWESICLPPYDPTTKALKDSEIDAIQLDSDVVFQLKDFVTNLAIMHRDNPYHNFEHSSHACMHVTKCLSRIITRVKEGADNPVLLKSLHDRTFRVIADPLTEFALVFASLIVSIDHPGVPNSQVIKEKKEMARAFRGKSITQSNAFLLAWDLLLDADYKELRQAICATKEEAKRFRQIVVNCVMATDVSDKELQAAREQKWRSAFSEKRSSLGSSSHHRDPLTGQVTSVVELLVQSADLSHTMQHYQVFCKWNERRFMESFKAYRAGRLDQNPAEHWFEGQLRLYDELVLPMATKIKDCGIFGTSSDEMLDFAMKNRYLWKENGSAAVKQMAELADRSYPLKGTTEPRSLTAGNVAAPASVTWPVTAVPQPPRSAPISATSLPPTTLKIGENDVTTASVTSALSLLMQKVQIMSQQEEALMVRSSVAVPEAGASGAVADCDSAKDTKPSATAAQTTATIQSALKIIDSASHGNGP